MDGMTANVISYAVTMAICIVFIIYLQRKKITNTSVSSEKEPYLDQNVLYTIYRPRSVLPEKWYTLLAFAHLSEKRPDSPEDEPEPLDEVEIQAQEILGRKGIEYVERMKGEQAIPRYGEITFVPEIPEVEFNPSQRTFKWQESVHREEFRFKASSKLDGQTARGYVSVNVKLKIHNYSAEPRANVAEKKGTPAKYVKNDCHGIR